MYVAVRPYLTAGVAVATAGAIALYPIAPPPAEIAQKAQRAMSTALTASSAPLDLILANLEAAAAIPGPVAATVLGKAKTIAEEFAAGFGGLAGGDVPALSDGLPALLAYVADRLEPASERGYVIPGLYQDMSNAMFNGGRDILNLGIDSIQIFRFAAEIALEESLRSTGIGPLVDLANILYPLTVAGDQIGDLAQAQVTTMSNLVRDLVNIQISIVSPPVVGVIRDAVEAALIEALRIPAGLGTPQAVVNHLVKGGIDLAEKLEEAAATTLTAGGALTNNAIAMGSVFTGAISHAVAQLAGAAPITPPPAASSTLLPVDTEPEARPAPPTDTHAPGALSTFKLAISDLVTSVEPGGSRAGSSSTLVSDTGTTTAEADKKSNDSGPAGGASTEGGSTGSESADGSAAGADSGSGWGKGKLRHRKTERSGISKNASTAGGSEMGSGLRKGKPSHRKADHRVKKASTGTGSDSGSDSGSASSAGSTSSE